MTEVHSWIACCLGFNLANASMSALPFHQIHRQAHLTASPRQQRQKRLFPRRRIPAFQTPLPTLDGLVSILASQARGRGMMGSQQTWLMLKSVSGVLRIKTRARFRLNCSTTTIVQRKTA